MTKDDVEELIATVAKVVQDNLASLNTQQANIAKKVGDHLNKLIDAINEVKATVEAKTYGVDPNVPSSCTKFSDAHQSENIGERTRNWNRLKCL